MGDLSSVTTNHRKGKLSEGMVANKERRSIEVSNTNDVLKTFRFPILNAPVGGPSATAAGSLERMKKNLKAPKSLARSSIGGS
jgi:hypothetical protein